MRVEAPPAPRLHPEAVQPERRRAHPRETKGCVRGVPAAGLRAV